MKFDRPLEEELIKAGPEVWDYYCRMCYSENNVPFWGDLSECQLYLQHYETGFLATEEYKLETNVIDIYPNPTEDVFTIIGLHNQNIEILIINSSGQILEEYKSNQKSYQINASNWNKGIYFVQIKQENQMITKKLVVE